MMATSFSPHPGGMQQHPGVPPGHPMAPGMAHNPSQPGAQPGGIPQHLAHMGVSAPGGQVNPAALMGGMPPGAGGPNAHAMQHLNPQQAQLFQQQQQQMAFASNPALQHQIQQQRYQQMQQQRLLAQQAAGMYGNMNGVPMTIGMNQMTPQQMASIQAMRNMRPVALPPHLQQAQYAQIGQQAANNPQAQAMLAQHLALQQQQQAHHMAQNPNQQGQMSAQQLQGLQQAQIAAMQAQQQAQAAQQQHQHQQHQHQQQQQQHQQQQHQHQHQQQSQPPQPQPQQQPQQQMPQQPGQGGPQVNPGQPNQGQPQGHSPAQPNHHQQQPQAPPQTPQQTQPQPAQLMPAQQQVANNLLQAKREGMKGHCLLRLMQFSEHLSGFPGSRGKDDTSYWDDFVHRFFSPRGVFRHAIHDVDSEEQSDKQYEITFPALPRYFHTHFDSGVTNMQLIMDKGTTDKPLPGDCHFIENTKASLVYWFDSKSHLVASGTLRAQFDAEQKIELFEFLTTNHEEYISRRLVIEAAKPAHNWVKEWLKINSQDSKQSPEMSKKGKARAAKSPPHPPPDLDLPQSAVKQSVGITEAVHQFLEMTEIMGQMIPLFGFCHTHPGLAPYQALDQYVSNINNASQAMANGQGMPQGGPRTPSFGQFPMGQSPHAANMQLPGSPHIGSPAPGTMQAPGMQLQQSQQGTSSSGPSANTSPAGTKRRRPSSAVKNEEDTPGSAPTPSAAGGQVNGVPQTKTKPPTPRMPKRVKGNPA